MAIIHCESDKRFSRIRGLEMVGPSRSIALELGHILYIICHILFLLSISSCMSSHLTQDAENAENRSKSLNNGTTLAATTIAAGNSASAPDVDPVLLHPNDPSPVSNAARPNDANNNSATANAAPDAVAAAIERANASILALWAAETDMLDGIATGYWREMVSTKSAMDIKVMEHLEAVDAFQEREAAYKTHIAALERRVKELEGTVAEKERLLLAQAGGGAKKAKGGTLARTDGAAPAQNKGTSSDNSR